MCKIIEFFTYFNYFILFWGTVFWHSIAEKYFMIWYSLECNICISMFDYLTKTSVINLKQFTQNTIYIVSMSTNRWERLSWKMAYSMILVYNTKTVSGQLFGCGRVKLGPLGREHLHNLMLITELLLV